MGGVVVGLNILTVYIQKHSTLWLLVPLQQVTVVLVTQALSRKIHHVVKKASVFPPLEALRPGDRLGLKAPGETAGDPRLCADFLHGAELAKN